MPLRSILALGALALAQTVSGVIWRGPKQTPCGGKATIDVNGFSPLPTDAPGSKSLREHHYELFKRAIALPRTCGFLSDSKASAIYAYTCNIGTCGYFSSAGTYAQGCCYAGYSDCAVPTTCYDYAQYTSSRCTGSCALNDNNLICSRTSAPKCQTFTYPGRGVKGYGCDTDTESTTTTVVSTYVSGASGGSAFATTYTAFISSIPAYALTSSTTRSIFPTTTRYSGGSSSYYPNDGGLSTAPLVIIIVIVVLWGLGYLCALVFLILVCRRHKRNMAAINQQNAARAAGVPVFASAMPFNGSNVLSPGSHQSTYFGGSTVGGDPNQAAYYGNQKDVSPPTAQTYPAPMLTPPPMTGSPAQPMYGTAMSTPNTNSMYGFPQPQGQAPPQLDTHELYSPTPAVPAPQSAQAYAYAPPAGAPPAAPGPIGHPAPSTPGPMQELH